MRADQQLAHPTNIETPTMCLLQCWGVGTHSDKAAYGHSKQHTEQSAGCVGAGGAQRRDPAWGRGGASELRSDDKYGVGIGVAGSRTAFRVGGGAQQRAAWCLCVCVSVQPPLCLGISLHVHPQPGCRLSGIVALPFGPPRQASLFPVSVGCLPRSVSSTHSRDRGFFTPVSRAEY